MGEEGAAPFVSRLELAGEDVLDEVGELLVRSSLSDPQLVRALDEVLPAEGSGGEDA